MQLFGVWMVWKFGSFGIVVDLLPCSDCLGTAEALVSGEALLLLGFATSLGLNKISGDSSFITPS